MIQKIIIIILGAAGFLLTQCEKESRINNFQPNETLKGQSTVYEGVKLPYHHEGVLSQGALFVLSVPEKWNGRHLLVYAHGYVDPQPYESLKLPDDSVDDKSIGELINSMGWGFATTSYRDNGLVVSDAVEDLIELRDSIISEVRPENLYLAGTSEGGLITVLAIERYPDAFSGGLVIGGPIGNFYQQLQYLGDFHILFNYFFKDELEKAAIDLGDPTGVPVSTMTDWKSGSLQQKIVRILIGNEDKIADLLNCTKVPADRNNSAETGQTILDILNFNIMATNDVNQHLEGCIFNNKSPRRWYLGSGNDWQLNRNIPRIKANDFPVADKNIQSYETTGNLAKPLVTLHATGDPLTLYWHETLYRYKILRNRAASLQTNITVVKYGQSDFDQTRIISALALLVHKVTLNDLIVPAEAFTSKQMENEFLQKSKEMGISPEIDVNTGDVPGK
jgi:pimeloyl-ACP methyl ester carboxylesterase